MRCLISDLPLCVESLLTRLVAAGSRQKRGGAESRLFSSRREWEWGVGDAAPPLVTAVVFRQSEGKGCRGMGKAGSQSWIPKLNPKAGSQS